MGTEGGILLTHSPVFKLFQVHAQSELASSREANVRCLRTPTASVTNPSPMAAPNTTCPSGSLCAYSVGSGSDGEASASTKPFARRSGGAWGEFRCASNALLPALEMDSLSVSHEGVCGRYQGTQCPSRPRRAKDGLVLAGGTERQISCCFCFTDNCNDPALSSGGVPERNLDACRDIGIAVAQRAGELRERPPGPVDAGGGAIPSLYGSRAARETGCLWLRSVITLLLSLRLAV